MKIETNRTWNRNANGRCYQILCFFHCIEYRHNIDSRTIHRLAVGLISWFFGFVDRFVFDPGRFSQADNMLKDQRRGT